MAETTVTVRAHINSTESQEKLEKAMTNLFGELQIKRVKIHGLPYLEAKATGILALSQLRQRIASDRIRDACRVMLNRWASKTEKVTFQLNRQAAYVNHVSIYHASKVPLGSIEVEIDGDPEEIVRFLCG